MKTITLSANTSWYLFNFRASTLRALTLAGYRVICLSPRDDYSDRLVSELGCEWHPLAMKNSGRNPVQEVGLILQFWRYYRRFRPQAALHFTLKNNVYGSWAARALGVPAINNVSGLGTAFIRRGLVSALVRLLYKTSQPFAHRVFCQNEEDLKQLVDAKLVPPERLELLPGSGVDLQRFRPELKQAHIGPLRFLYAGRMLADKGLYELIAAVRGLHSRNIECTLWLSGFADVENVSAIDREELAQWALEAGIEWLGSSDAMESIYAQVDCVVLPSYREGMPRSLLEAGAMGLPVIATDVPGCRNIVVDGHTGLLCLVKDSGSLMQAMQTVIAMTTSERVRMGENGRARVSESYGEKNVVDATMRAIESAIRVTVA